MQAITPTLLCYSTESVHQGPGQQLISRIRCAGKPTGGSSPGGGLLYRTLVVRSSPSDSFVKSESSLINWVLFLSVGGTAKGTLCGEPSAPLRRCQQPLLFPKNNETDEVITSINVPLGVEECQQANNGLSQVPELKQVIQVDSGKDAVLECSVNFNGISPGNVNIEKVVWWRLDQNGLHKGGPVFICNLFNQQSSNPRMPLSPKYQLPMPPANEKDKVVSLLVKETQPEDEGPYRCVVNTDSGITNCNFMLNVTGNLTGQLKAFGLERL
uniref:Ig-like domain-containing protein n=1 Tax=Oncorhynchus tshawytscha TaxID=74940 RepID=A0AAZ3RQF6_ONCTS